MTTRPDSPRLDNAPVILRVNGRESLLAGAPSAKRAWWWRVVWAVVRWVVG